MANEVKKNESQFPVIYYFRHIKAGVCRYVSQDGSEEIILINDDCLKQMDRTFSGKPVYVEHQEVNLPKLSKEADGYVIESFYLEADGSHWGKMLIVSDAGHDAVKKGFKVSNAYNLISAGAGGTWHNVPYNREVLRGEYNHLALVERPRYEEAVIMTEEEFRKYKDKKESELKNYKNSKDADKKGKETKMPFGLFKRTKVENSADNITAEELQTLEVEVSAGKFMPLADIVNSVQEAEKKKEKEEKEKENSMKKVKVNGEEMTVEELVNRYKKLNKKKNESGEEKDNETDEDEKDNCSDAKKGVQTNKKKNESKDEDEKDNESDEEDEEKKKNKKKNSKDEDGKDVFEKLQNARENFEKSLSGEDGGYDVDTMDAKVKRGNERYGSASKENK